MRIKFSTLTIVAIENTHFANKIPQVIINPLEPSGRTVEGKVVDGDGHALAGAGVYTGSPRGTPEVQTAEDGSFVLWLSDVETMLSASKRDYSFGYAEIPESASGSTEPVIITLFQGGWLAGVVTIDGLPVARREAAVLALLPDGMMLPRLQTQSAEDGTFRIDGLTPGELGVEIVLNELERYVTLETQIEDGQESWIEVDVSTGHNAAVAGHVYLDGKPAAGAVLFAWSELPGGARLGARSISNAQGEYRIEGLASGYLEMDVRAPYSAGTQAISALLQLQSGSIVERDFHLAP